MGLGFREIKLDLGDVMWKLRDFSGGSEAKNLPTVQKIPRLRRSPGEGNGNSLQYSCLENPTDRKRSLGGYSP